MTPIRSALTLSLVGVLTMASCGDDSTPDDAGAPVVALTVNVGRTQAPLSQLLAEIYIQGLENAGVRVGRKDPVADQSAAYAAITADRIQLVPETTGALLALLDVVSPATADEQITAVNDALPDTLTVSGVASALATKVVVCGAAAIEEHSLATITDLAKVADTTTLGAPASFETDLSFGLDTLNTAYEATFTFVATDDVPAAIAAGDIDCGVVSSLLPAITTEGLLVLTDDKSAAPADAILGLMTTAAATPELISVITQINGSLSTDVLRALLVKAERGDETPDVIAKQFLASLSAEQ